ncbi:pilus assembly FimT family protein [Ruminococcus flavefaciens]|uniref:pilus assembly FimT family protein n=1 Tax=Ruminococcus flavefaciens TaxID=1265 RepID=UPI0004B9CB47|nr:type II secretion system protein [Ruminococcus flavefaciens]
MKAKKTRKGFTLMELIIVIAIMGILMAIIIPSWGYFLRRARERDANSKAKIVFNAAQTAVTRICDNERSLLNKYNDPTVATDVKDEIGKQIYMGDGEFYFYWNGSKGVKIKSNGSVDNEAANSKKNGDLSRAINNITGGEGFYKIYVKNYNVQSVVYTAYVNGNYKGTYPKGTNELDNDLLDKLRNTSMNSINDETLKKLVVTK